VLSNGDIATHGRIYNRSMIIYHRNSEYDTFKELSNNKPMDTFNCITSLSDNNTAVNSIRENVIYVYDMGDDYKCVKEFLSYQNWIHELLYIRQNSLLISGSIDRKIKFWSVNDDYNCIKTIITHEAVYYLLLLSGGYFASGGVDGIKIYHMKSYELINHLDKHYSTTSFKQLDDNRIISSSSDGAVMIWNYHL
jgi:WD40 repeat protein